MYLGTVFGKHNLGEGVVNNDDVDPVFKKYHFANVYRELDPGTT